MFVVPLGVLSRQYDVERRYDVEQLHEDFDVLRLALEQGHSGLYRYSSKEAIDGMFDGTAGSIDAAMTELEFLRFISPVIAGVNDGHMRLLVSEGLAAHLENQPHHLPFKLAFVAGRAYLHRDYTAPRDIDMGAELTHLNGMPLSEVTARILWTFPSDGRVETSKWRRLERATTFGNAYTGAFGISTRFELRYRTPDGRTHERTFSGITQARLLRRFRDRYPEAAENRPPIELTYTAGIPVLTVRTFGSGAYPNAGIDYPQFLDSAFTEFESRGARQLIIDVRNNGGGSDEYGKLLAAHLLNREFFYYESLIVNRDRFDFLDYTSMSNDDMPRDRLRERADGNFDVLGHSNLGPQQPESPVFDGDVYILINGASFSATGEFTSVVHHHRRATFVGEESGAGYYGNTSGMGVTVTLPNTKLRVRIPMMRYTMAVSGYEPTDRGLIPDHPVTPTLDDIMSGRDAVLEYVVGLIRQ